MKRILVFPALLVLFLCSGASALGQEEESAPTQPNLELRNWRVFAGGEFQTWSAPGGPAYLDQLEPGTGGGATAGIAHEGIRITREDGSFFNLRLTGMEFRLSQGGQTNGRARYGTSGNFQLATGHLFGDPSLDEQGRTLNFYLLGETSGLVDINVNELKPDQRQIKAGIEAGILGQAGHVLVLAGFAVRGIAGEANDGVFGYGTEMGAILRIYAGDFSITGQQSVASHWGSGGTDLALDHTQAIRVAWHPDNKFEIEASLARTATSRVPNEPGAIDYLYHAPDDSSAITAGVSFGFKFDETRVFSAQ